MKFFDKHSWKLNYQNIENIIFLNQIIKETFFKHILHLKKQNGLYSILNFSKFKFTIKNVIFSH